jgi:hypothetical protein
MTTLEFKPLDVMRVTLHSLESPTQNPFAYTKDPVPEPSVILVHDEGIYLMSNGTPRDILPPSNEEKQEGLKESKRNFAAYATGCHPDLDEQWWETSRQLVGGDDFAITIPKAELLLKIARETNKTNGTLTVTIDKNGGISFPKSNK